MFFPPISGEILFYLPIPSVSPHPLFFFSDLRLFALIRGLSLEQTHFYSQILLRIGFDGLNELFELARGLVQIVIELAVVQEPSRGPLPPIHPRGNGIEIA